ncbi:MAG: hypothetical protein O7D91_10045 [Planctomycetota bacterium]|nr:hypothetical protein [Planctomycetota bacterium]
MQQDCDGEPCPPIDCTAELGLDICRLYADFDAQYPVHLFSVGFADITTTDPDGFYQNPFGFGDTAPLCFFYSFFPDLQCDSFVTIGYACGPSPDGTDATWVDNRWDSCAFNCNTGGSGCEDNVLCGQALGGWFNASPPNGQGNPMPGPDPDIFRVLIAQFAMSAGENVSGSVEVFWHEHPGDTQATMADFSCFSPCPADFDGSGGVGAFDLAQLLGSWGPCFGCPADLDGDDAVGAFDLALLLGSWGPCS